MGRAGEAMWKNAFVLLAVSLVWLAPVGATRSGTRILAAQAGSTMRCRLEPSPGDAAAIRRRYEPAEVGLLEKLNRIDRAHLAELDPLVVPALWLDDELAYSPFSATYEPAVARAKLLLL